MLKLGQQLRSMVGQLHHINTGSTGRAAPGCLDQCPQNLHTYKAPLLHSHSPLIFTTHSIEPNTLKQPSTTNNRQDVRIRYASRHLVSQSAVADYPSFQVTPKTPTTRSTTTMVSQRTRAASVTSCSPVVLPSLPSRPSRTTSAVRVRYPAYTTKARSLTLSSTGKPVSHQFAKELLAGFAGAEVDKLAETKGMGKS